MKDDASGRTSEALYSKQIAGIPLLTKEQERELGMRIAKKDADSAVAAQQLVTAHLRWAHKVARYIWNRPENRNRKELEDLTQIANEALMRAAQTYDYKKGIAFSTHAHNWILALIREDNLLGDPIRIPLSAHNRASSIRKAIKGFIAENGREPTIEELSKLTDLSPKQITDARKVGRVNLVSLNAPLSVDTDTALGDVISDENAMSPEDVSMQRDQLKAEKVALADIFDYVRSLSPARSRAFFAVFGPDPESSAVTPVKDVAERFGVTQQAITLHIREIWKKLGYGGKVELGSDPVTSARERIARLQAIVDSAEASPPLRQRGRNGS